MLSSQGDGISVHDGAKATVVGGRVAGSGYDGVSASGASSAVELMGVVVERSAQCGVRAWFGGAVSLRECAVSGSGEQERYEHNGTICEAELDPAEITAPAAGQAATAAAAGGGKDHEGASAEP